MRWQNTLRVVTLAGIALLASIALQAQSVNVESFAIVDEGSVPERGMTVSRAGVEVSFAAVIDEGRLEGYDYRGVDQLKDGDAIVFQSEKFVPRRPIREDGSLDPGDDQFVVARIASVSSRGANIKIDLAEPIEVFNASVMAHGRRGNAPPPGRMFTKRLMFVQNSDGSYRLVSAPKGHSAKPEKQDG